VSQRAFIILLILLAVVVALSAASFPGAMIGFLFGITVAFFIAIPGAAIGDALHRAGVPVTGEQLAWAAGGLYAVFVLSGAAGLIYESIWTRYLGLFVGHSAYAQVIVLVMFLGGMSIGALIIGRASERIKHPLYWYPGVELATGLIGLVFHDAFVATTSFA